MRNIKKCTKGGFWKALMPKCLLSCAFFVAEWGFFYGLKLTISRLCRCNPRSKGGVDPVPINPKKQYKNFM